MSKKKRTVTELEKKRILLEAEDSWLHIDVQDHELYNPLIQMPDEFHGEEHLYIQYLFTRPEYFSFICKEILNIELLPTQIAILQELWLRKFPMFIASRGFGKSFLLAVYALLRALLYPGRKIVICGSVFRQSKVIFEYIENVWRNAPILRDICSASSGPRHDVDMWRFHVNQSVISALPIGTGDNIRGQRANDIIMDEFACLSYTSMVETENGFIRISDFDKCGILPTGDDLVKYEKPTKFIKTPLTDVYEVKLQNGYVIRCSKIHQLMTKAGWKLAIDLKNGDFIEETRSDNGFSWGKSNLIDKKTSWLIGYLISEGHITSKNTISVVTTDFGIAQKLVNEYNFKIYVKEEYTDKRGFDCKKTYHLRKNNKKFRNYLHSLGLDYIKAGDKIVPSSILQSPKVVVEAFLSGLFEGDGSCFLWKDKKVKRIGLAYYSVSERLCRDVQILMNKMGYDGYITSRDSTLSENRQWMVRWNGEQAKNAATMLNVDRFRESIEKCHIGKTKPKQDGITYRKVLSVTKLTEQEHLYDYYLPQTNSFYADGFRQHNTSSEDVFETVIAGFGAVAPSPAQAVKAAARKKFLEKHNIFEESNIILAASNQIVLAGTAFYSFNHFCRYWNIWRGIINSKGDPEKVAELFGGEVPKDFNWKDYSVMRVPLELVPDGFMDEASIARSKATSNSGTYLHEYRAVFVSDSAGFFKRSIIEKCVASEKNKISFPSCGDVTYNATLYGDRSKQYIMGIDPAATEDNFAIVILELHVDHRRVVYCWTTNKADHSQKQKRGLIPENDYYSYCVRKIRDLMKAFPIERIVLDSQGGGRAILESLENISQLEPNEQPIYCIIDPDKPQDSDNRLGLHIVEPINFVDAKWTTDANQGLCADLENRVLLFPFFDSITLAEVEFSDSAGNAKFDNLEDNIVNIEELKNELSTIVITETATGRPRWDTPDIKGAGSKKGRLKKDRYSALLMANMSARSMINDNQITYDMVGEGGGFINTIRKSDLEGPLFSGNQRWAKALNDLFG